jgi:hypothetical protein
MNHSPVGMGWPESASPAGVEGHPNPGPGGLPGADPTRSRMRGPKVPDPPERSSGRDAPTEAPPPRTHRSPLRQQYGHNTWRRGEPDGARTPRTHPPGVACPI